VQTSGNGSLVTSAKVASIFKEIRMKHFLLSVVFSTLMLGNAFVLAQPGEGKPQPSPETVAKIAEFERQLDQQAGKFDWRIHNELRHLYGGFDARQAYHHCDVILKNAPMDDYILSILSGWEIKDNRPKAVENLQEAAVKYSGFKCLTAACLIKAGDLEVEKDKAQILYRRVIDMRGPDLAGYRKLAEGGLAKLQGEAGAGGTGAPMERVKKAPRK
jgi:hypothetical protein